MDPDLHHDVPSTPGPDLANYFPTKCSYDSVVYVHKKFLPQYKGRLEKKYETPKLKRTWDKSQQFDTENLNKDTYKVRDKVKEKEKRDPVVEQAIRFAKTIIPFTIPPSADVSPQPEYTIKAIKHPKHKTTNPNNTKHQSAKNKEKSKNIIEHFKREKLKRHKDRISARETVSSSQDNTLDDIDENRTLSCTLSEISEQKCHKENRHCKRNKRNEMQKVAVSESFEAVANEFMNTSSPTKIKIHLMNDREKSLLCENIQAPVIGALKEFITQLNNENVRALQYMQSSIEHQTKQMDVILDKMTTLEEKLKISSRDKSNRKEISKIRKPSKLEELGADCEVQAMNSSEEELGQIGLFNKIMKDKSVDDMKLKAKNVLRHEKNKIEILGCGEDVASLRQTEVGVKTDQPNRVPARFCWTDVGKN